MTQAVLPQPTWFKSAFFFLLLLLAGWLCQPVAEAQGQPSGRPDSSEAEQIERLEQRYAEGAFRTVAERLESESDLSPQGHALLGRAYQKLLRHRRAIQALSRADTTRKRVLTALGRSQHQLGRNEEAVASYERAYQQDSLDVQVAQTLAGLYAQVGRYERATSVYHRLLREDSGNPFFLEKLGNVYQALGDTEKALHFYGRAYYENPESTALPLRLSRLHLEAGQHEQAARIVERALGHHPSHARLLKRRGRVALLQGDYERAIEGFGSSIARGDSSAANLRGLGRALFREEEHEHARLWLGRARRADTTSAQTHYYLGLALKKLGEDEEALAALRRAAELHGEDRIADIYEQAADVHRRQKRFERAIEADRIALKLSPAKDAVVFHLATLYDEYYADPKPAIAHYRQFLRRVREGDLPAMQSHAERRIRALEQREFWSPQSPPSLSDSAASH